MIENVAPRMDFLMAVDDDGRNLSRSNRFLNVDSTILQNLTVIELFIGLLIKSKI